MLSFLALMLIEVTKCNPWSSCGCSLHLSNENQQSHKQESLAVCLISGQEIRANVLMPCLTIKTQRQPQIATFYALSFPPSLSREIFLLLAYYFYTRQTSLSLIH